MKTRIGFFYGVLLILAGMTFCTEPVSSPPELLPTRVIIVFNDTVTQGDPAQNPDPGGTNNGTWAGRASDYLNPLCVYDSITDIEGNVYKTVQIGDQVWMAENLRTTRYNDGIAIPNVIINSVWVSLKTGAYRWYENNSFRYKDLYGALYNWYTVKTGKLCPVGWHVPSDEDWIKLEMELGMPSVEAYSWGEFFGIDARGTDQGSQMKAMAGWTEWEGIDGNGTNTSGFTALPAGESGWGGNWNAYVYTYYCGEGICTTWWDSTSEGGGRAITGADDGVIRGVYPAFCGLSVRCLRD